MIYVKPPSADKRPAQTYNADIGSITLRDQVNFGQVTGLHVFRGGCQGVGARGPGRVAEQPEMAQHSATWQTTRH